VPYKVVQNAPHCSPGKPWACVNSSSGEVMGCFATQAEAVKQQRALYANESQIASMMQPGGEGTAQSGMQTPGSQG
jgi:hypothetical protein